MPKPQNPPPQQTEETQQPVTELPLFPLSTVVLFPLARVPLHIFEPRYRQMLEASLKGDRRIGMVTVLPEHQDEMSGDPPVFPVGCAGFVVDVVKLADGRYDLILQGTERFRIRRELPPNDDRLYRLAEVESLEEAPPRDEDSAQLAERRARVVELLVDLAQRASPDSAVELPSEQLEELDDATFANCLCQALGLAPAEKQGLLEANGVAERIERLENLLEFHLALLRSPGPDGPQTLH